jgi:hypothetical protein
MGRICTCNNQAKHSEVRPSESHGNCVCAPREQARAEAATQFIVEEHAPIIVAATILTRPAGSRRRRRLHPDETDRSPSPPPPSRRDRPEALDIGSWPRAEVLGVDSWPRAEDLGVGSWTADAALGSWPRAEAHTASGRADLGEYGAGEDGSRRAEARTASEMTDASPASAGRSWERWG